MGIARLFASAGLAALAGCGLVTSLDGFSGTPSPVDADAGVARVYDAADATEAAVNEVHDAASPDAGVELRGLETFFSEFTTNVALARPASTSAGDVMWAVLLMTSAGGTVTPPAGFKSVNSDSHVCGSKGTALYVFVHVATGTEPASLDFGLEGGAWTSAVLLTLVGIAGTLTVETSAMQRVGDNPFTMPTLEAGDRAAFGIGIYTGVAGYQSTTFPVPPGTTRLVGSNGLAVFTRDVSPKSTFISSSIDASEPSCGFVHGALLKRP